MIDPKLARREFLQRAGQTLAVLPILSALPAALEAQTPAAVPAHKPVAHAKPAVHLNVRDFGATGDGTTKDTLALQQALDRCNLLGGGEVLVPAGNYLSGSLVLRSNTVLRIDDGASLLGSPDLADYPLTQVRWEGKFIKGYSAFLTATEAENVTITGKGKIIGNDAIKGRTDRKTGLRYPALIEFTSCTDVLMEDCFTQQNGMWSIHPLYCEHITFRNVTVHGGADGIDVDSCRHVIIDGCEFETRDDCISLKSGRGEEGYTILRPTEDVRISNCTFTDAYWACIGIGSETSGGIRNVRVEHCKCLGARTYAIYIKSHPGRGAYIEDISMNGIDVSGAKQGFLRINNLNSGKQDEVPVPGEAGIPALRNFSFNNIRVTDEAELVHATEIHPDKPLDGFSLTNISGTCGSGISLANIRNAVLSNIKVTGFTGPLLSTHNVTGTGLAGAVPLKPEDPVDPVPEPAQPYILQ